MDEGLSEYAAACAHDRKGEEAEAIPHYEAALALGLPVDERRGALVGLGSSLRNVARHADSVTVLTNASLEFPQDPALKAFLALSLYSAGEPAKALALLLRTVCEQTEAREYQRALTAYAAEIESTETR